MLPDSNLCPVEVGVALEGRIEENNELWFSRWELLASFFRFPISDHLFPQINFIGKIMLGIITSMEIQKIYDLSLFRVSNAGKVLRAC